MLVLKIVVGLFIGTLLLFLACASPTASPSASLSPAPSSSPVLTQSPTPSQTTNQTPAQTPSATLAPAPIPTHPPFPQSLIFTKITAPLTVSDKQPGTPIPWGSVIYHWANGITEAYSANNSLIFVAKDSEAAIVYHPHPTNYTPGPWDDSATHMLQVPNGAAIVKDKSDNNTTRVYLNQTLILTIINKTENYPLEPSK